MRRIRRHPKRVAKSSCSIHTKEGVIPYILTRSSGRRSLTISVDEHVQTGVAAPYTMAEKEIHAFIREKAEWIVKKLKEARAYRDLIDQKKFDDGHTFLFLGKKFMLNITSQDVKRGSIKFDPLGGWFVTVPRNLPREEQRCLVEKKMLQWYRAQAKEILGGRVFHYSRLLGVAPKNIAVRTQKRLWGCCDFNTQTIHLNWQIILSPMHVVDYIAAHELCHLQVPNHSKRFWKKLEKLMPDYKRRQKWLKDNHADMILP